MRTEFKIQSELSAAMTAYHESPSLGQSEVIKALRSELQLSLTDGANPCTECEQLPLGIHQPNRYEVGCLVCKGKRAFGRTVDEAVSNWNSGDFKK